MYVQSLALTQKLPWHRPLIVDDIRKSPPAAQLSLSTSTHRYMVLNRDEHEAELRKARVDAYRERQVDITEDGEKKLHPRSRCYVTYDGIALEGLVKLGQILDHETGDARIVGEALSDIIAEALTPEKVTEALRQREERDRRAKAWGS